MGTTKTGIISKTARGVGYVPLDGFSDDIEIAPEQTGISLHGDEVEIELLPKVQGRRQQGKVLRIIERRKMELVGLVKRANGSWRFIPDERRVRTEFSIENPPADLKEEVKAVLDISAWSDPKNPVGEVVRIIGPAGVHETEIEAILIQNEFELSFPPQVEREAEAIGENRAITDDEITKRRDFRNVTTFTIDPDDAKDFDDALSFKRLEGGDIEIGIHIADVTHYVTPGSAIDKEAQERGTSVYLVDRTIPMLPEVLSNDVCSLNPNEDKLAFSAVFTLSPEAEVKDSWFGRTVINSDKRFTYKTAQDAIESGKGEFAEELKTMNGLAHILREARRRDGSIAFEQDEVKFELDGAGNPIRAYVKELLDTNRMIEDFMLLANRKVAEYVHNLAKGSDSSVFIYRIHDQPDPDKIEELSVFLKAIGYELDHKRGEVSAKEINRLLKQIEGKPEEKLIQVATIRSMAKAIYTTKNIGHFSLSFRYYTHFTSPIRRYPDMMVHRILASHLNGTQIPKKELDRYQKLAIESSRREIEAVSAERESVKYMQVKYMQDRVGETFEGRVSGVTEFGIFIEEKSTKAEGLVRIADLPGYFELDKSGYALVNKKSNTRYQLGDTVTVTLTAADPELRQLTWKLHEPK